MNSDTMNQNYCGNCKHWHEWAEEEQKYSLMLGNCDKISKGKMFDNEYTYDGYSFEDECYDDVFNCFEVK